VVLFLCSGRTTYYAHDACYNDSTPIGIIQGNKLSAIPKPTTSYDNFWSSVNVRDLVIICVGIWALLGVAMSAIAMASKGKPYEKIFRVLAYLNPFGAIYLLDYWFTRGDKYKEYTLPTKRYPVTPNLCAILFAVVVLVIPKGANAFVCEMTSSSRASCTIPGGEPFMLNGTTVYSQTIRTMGFDSTSNSIWHYKRSEAVRSHVGCSATMTAPNSSWKLVDTLAYTGSEYANLPSRYCNGFEVGASITRLIGASIFSFGLQAGYVGVWCPSTLVSITPQNKQMMWYMDVDDGNTKTYVYTFHVSRTFLTTDPNSIGVDCTRGCCLLVNGQMSTTCGANAAANISAIGEVTGHEGLYVGQNQEVYMDVKYTGTCPIYKWYPQMQSVSEILSPSDFQGSSGHINSNFKNAHNLLSLLGPGVCVGQPGVAIPAAFSITQEQHGSHWDWKFNCTSLPDVPYFCNSRLTSPQTVNWVWALPNTITPYGSCSSSSVPDFTVEADLNLWGTQYSGASCGSNVYGEVTCNNCTGQCIWGRTLASDGDRFCEYQYDLQPNRCKLGVVRNTTSWYLFQNIGGKCNIYTTCSPTIEVEEGATYNLTVPIQGGCVVKACGYQIGLQFDYIHNTSHDSESGSGWVPTSLPGHASIITCYNPDASGLSKVFYDNGCHCLSCQLSNVPFTGSIGIVCPFIFALFIFAIVSLAMCTLCCVIMIIKPSK